jgi:hypothetical protein
MHFGQRPALIAGLVLFVVVAGNGSLFAAPIISSMSPTSGTSGTLVTITGTGFGSTKGTSTVKFGAVAATVLRIKLELVRLCQR